MSASGRVIAIFASFFGLALAVFGASAASG